MKSLTKKALLVAILPVLFAAINVETLSMIAFAWEGLLSITFPALATLWGGSAYAIGTENAGKGCYSDHSWILQRLVNLTEKSLANDKSHAESSSVREAQSCENTLLSTTGGRLTPFVIRADGKRQFDEFSSKWLLKRFGNVIVRATDMQAFGTSIEEISRCPFKRKGNTQEMRLKDMARKTHLYANFNGKTRDAIYSQIQLSGFFRFINIALNGMCSAFQGWRGEIFFGWTSSSKSSVSGTGFHCAAMENIFFQVHGERNWTLVDPRYTMRMRPIQGLNYMVGAGLYEQNWNTIKRPSHWDSIPKMTVTTRPGDILFIPTWWWHEVRIENDGFSVGISHRNHWTDLPLRQYPLVRFIPGVISKIPQGAGLMPILLDAVHSSPELFSSLLLRMGLISKDRYPHPTVEATQHEK